MLRSVHGGKMVGTVLIFAKPPRMGLSKTRLAAGIGAAEAQRMAAWLTARTLREAADPRWRTEIRISPDTARLPGPAARRLPHKPQGRGDLGDRFARAFAAARHAPVIVIGTDAPDISRGLIWRGFQALKRHDAVIGPSLDGGFWLFGLRPGAYRPGLFSGIRWSTRHAFSDLLLNLPEEARHICLPPLLDIDTAEDLRLWQRK